MDKLSLLTNGNYRVLTPDDVSLVIETVVSSVEAVFPIGLLLFVILLIVDFIPAIIRAFGDREFRAGLKRFLSYVNADLILHVYGD